MSDSVTVTVVLGYSRSLSASEMTTLEHHARKLQEIIPDDHGADPRMLYCAAESGTLPWRDTTRQPTGGNPLDDLKPTLQRGIRGVKGFLAVAEALLRGDE